MNENLDLESSMGASSADGECERARRGSTLDPASDLALLKQWTARVLGTRSSVALIGEVREALVQEALARTRGNITRAARLLGVTRQALQQLHERSGAAAWRER